MKIFLIIYLISLLPLVTYITLFKMWNNRDGGLKSRMIMTFVPVLNTLIMLLCLFYLFPSEYARKRFELEYTKHKTDVRWKLMNIKQI